MVKSKVVNPKIIKQILTLRYSTELETKIPKLNWQNFTAKQENNPTDFIENEATAYLKGRIGNSYKKTVSIALSSGVDSTLVLSFLKKSLPDVKIKAISVKFDQSHDETKKAANLANFFNLDHEVIFLENVLKELPKAISIVKLPFWDLHWYYVAKKAKTVSEFIASGDGGDELFGGYTFRYAKFLSLIKKNASTEKKIKSYLQSHERDWAPDQEKIFTKKIKFSWKEIYGIFTPYFTNPLNPLEQVFLADFNGKLRYNFSIVNNSINSHFGIKAVTPLLSKNMIRYATHLPTKVKYDKNLDIGKIPLRQILRKEGLDKFIIKSKQGFSVNTKNLWNSYGQEICDYYLSDARIVRDGWINKDWIKKYIQRKDLDVRYVNKFLGLLAFEIWYRMFSTHEFNANSKLC